MDQVVKTRTIVVRSILWRDTDRSILFYRTPFQEGMKGDGSHWELPNRKILPGEDLQAAAERAAYDTAGVLAENSVVLRQCPPNVPQGFGQIEWNLDNYYVVSIGLSGRFDQDDFRKSHEGEAQWIQLDYLSCYLIRQETQAMIASIGSILDGK